MTRRVVTNIEFSVGLLLGLALLVGGATVPSEPTVAVGLMLVFVAATALLVVNYPSPQAPGGPVKTARIYVFPDRRADAMPQPANDLARSA